MIKKKWDEIMKFKDGDVVVDAENNKYVIQGTSEILCRSGGALANEYSGRWYETRYNCVDKFGFIWPKREDEIVLKTEK